MLRIGFEEKPVKPHEQLNNIKLIFFKKLGKGNKAIY
jgi:hypothetical protein